ncbi:MAG: outer membrane beta-barrel protein [Cyclobacteriaceae bacterium]
MKQLLFLSFIIAPLLSFSNGYQGLTNGVEELRKKQKSMATPDVPGNLTVDLGFNFLFNKAPAMQTKFWGSKSAGLYYTFQLNPKGTFFSINTGLGLGLEKYALEDDITLSTTEDATLGRVATIDTLAASLNGKKSKIAANYLEIPLEIRIYTNTTNREKGAYFSMGATAGILYQSFTKVKFSENGVDSKVKNNTDFELNPFRATAIFRIGTRGFNVFYRFGITELFEDGKGPNGAKTKFNTFGISFIGF